MSIDRTTWTPSVLKPGEETFFHWKRGPWSGGVDFLNLSISPKVSLEWKMLDGKTKELLEENITPRGWLQASFKYEETREPLLGVKNVTDDTVVVTPEVISVYEASILEALGALFR
jgi:hypothetical protein